MKKYIMIGIIACFSLQTSSASAAGMCYREAYWNEPGDMTPLGSMSRTKCKRLLASEGDSGSWIKANDSMTRVKVRVY